MTLIAGKINDYTAAGTPGKLFIPDDYFTSGKKYPFLMVFSGTGELSAGSVLNQGIGKKLNAGWNSLPAVGYDKFIVWIPIAQQGWNPTVENYLSFLYANINIDQKRQYITGLSQGATDALKFILGLFDSTGNFHNFTGALLLSPGALDVTEDQWRGISKTTYFWFWVGDLDKTCPRFYDDYDTTKIEGYNHGTTRETVIAGEAHDAGLWDQAYSTTGTTPDSNPLMWLQSLNSPVIPPLPPPTPTPIPINQPGVKHVITVMNDGNILVDGK